MKKDNKIIVFYDELERKDIYKLNGVDVSDTIEMLKDKWEREVMDTKCKLFELDMSIQMKLHDQIKLTKKALELAVADKCKFENAWLREILHKGDAKMAAPYKEQWYLEQARKEIMKSE